MAAELLINLPILQGWVDKEHEAQPDLDEIEEDEEYLEQAEKFEARYNHRFEVSNGCFGGGCACLTHPSLQPWSISLPCHISALIFGTPQHSI